MPQPMDVKAVSEGHWSVMLDYLKANNPPEIGGSRLLLVEDNGTALFGFYDKKKGIFRDEDGTPNMHIAWWAYLTTPFLDR